VLHVDVVVAMVPDRLDTEVLGVRRRVRVVGGQLMTCGARVDEEGGADVAFAGQNQNPRVDTLTVQHVSRCPFQLLRHTARAYDADAT